MKIDLEPAEIEHIGQLLATHPYREVAPLLAKIGAQVNANNQGQAVPEGAAQFRKATAAELASLTSGASQVSALAG